MTTFIFVIFNILLLYYVLQWVIEKWVLDLTRGLGQVSGGEFVDLHFFLKTIVKFFDFSNEGVFVFH